MSTIETNQPSVASADTIVAPASGQANGALPTPTSSSQEGFQRFLQDFRKYETVVVR